MTVTHLSDAAGPGPHLEVVRPDVRIERIGCRSSSTRRASASSTAICGEANDRVTVRGDLAAREFIAFWHRDGVVTAAMNVNVWDVVEDLKAIVEARKPLDPAHLADPDVPLGDLQ